MIENISLKFEIILYPWERKKEKHMYLQKIYDANLTLKQVLVEIYHEYGEDEEEKKSVGLSEHQILIYDPNLFDISYSFKDLDFEPDVYEYENYKLKDLEKQFSISKKNFILYIDPGIGGDVGRCRGIHFFFHTNEKDIHYKPHIHCKCGGEEFRIDLLNLKLLDKPFKNKKRTKLAIDLVRINQSEFIKYWNEVVVNGETVKLKMYIPKHY